MLDSMSESPSPTAKLLCILSANQAICDEHDANVADNHRVNNSPTPAHLGADQTLPIYIFVVSRAVVFLHRPLHTMQFLTTLTDSLLRDGEAGYYLTMCASALHFLLEEFPTSPEKGSEPDHRRRIISPASPSADDVKEEKEGMKHKCVAVWLSESDEEDEEDEGEEDLKEVKVEKKQQQTQVQVLVLAKMEGVEGQSGSGNHEMNK